MVSKNWQMLQTGKQPPIPCPALSPRALPHLWSQYLGYSGSGSLFHLALPWGSGCLRCWGARALPQAGLRPSCPPRPRPQQEKPPDRAGTAGHWARPRLPGFLVADTPPQGAEDLQALGERTLRRDSQGSAMGPACCRRPLSVPITGHVLNMTHRIARVLHAACSLPPSSWAWSTHCTW